MVQLTHSRAPTVSPTHSSVHAPWRASSWPEVACRSSTGWWSSGSRCYPGCAALRQLGKRVPTLRTVAPRGRALSVGQGLRRLHFQTHAQCLEQKELREHKESRPSHDLVSAQGRAQNSLLMRPRSAPHHTVHHTTCPTSVFSTPTIFSTLNLVK